MLAIISPAGYTFEAAVGPSATLELGAWLSFEFGDAATTQIDSVFSGNEPLVAFTAHERLRPILGEPVVRLRQLAKNESRAGS